ncbi:tetratricopeptide repeat protein [Trichloromonas sp.]|uniref:tetratricopeptide repeat protein n=1 Tax=Trichloromonas sp. TaxID=3069249 RepID=UPI003D814270
MRILLLCCLIPLLFACEKKRDEPAPVTERAAVPVEAAAPVEAAVPVEVADPNLAPPPAEVAEPLKAAEPAEGQAAARTFVPLLQQGSEPVVIELVSEALALWRPQGGAEQQPTLLLLSNDPFLRSFPPQLAQEVERLAKVAPPEELRLKGSALTADPVLISSMSLSAALQSGFFSRLVWVLPVAPETEGLSLEVLRKQMLDYGAMNAAEAESLSLVDGVFSGTVRGIPLQMASLSQLPAIEGPTLLHIDLSYFKPLYKGEIKTPLYPLVLQTLYHLRNSAIQVGGATISLSHLEGGLPLETRFIGADLAEVFRRPELIDAALLPAWERRGQALYLENFFQKEKVRDLYQQMAEADPRDASVKFALYQVLRQFKEGSAALESLAEAVALDRTYALEYLNLAPVALEKGLFAQGLNMLELAEAALPQNPFILLEKARILQENGHGSLAVEPLTRLRQMAWSPIYYPDMPQLLGQMEEAAKQAPQPPTPEPAPAN